jgi:acetyl esterase/lipase
MFMSPAIAPDALLRKFPPTNVMCGGMDPLLDDAVDFYGRLVRVGVPANLKIYRTMPHGFLSMDLVFRDAHRANTQLCWWINRMFTKEAHPRA